MSTIPTSSTPVKQENSHHQQLAQEVSNRQAMQSLTQTLAYLRSVKPIKRSETARRFAVTITELEKVAAYFQVYVVASKEK